MIRDFIEVVQEYTWIYSRVKDILSKNKGVKKGNKEGNKITCNT